MMELFIEALEAFAEATQGVRTALTQAILAAVQDPSEGNIQALQDAIDEYEER